MAGEKGNFRTALFGGFNRLDVINYIEASAAKHSACEKECSELRGELSSANDRVSSLEEENASLRREADRLRSQLNSEHKRREDEVNAAKAEASSAADDILSLISNARDGSGGMEQIIKDIFDISSRLSALNESLTGAQEHLNKIKHKLE